MGTYLGLEDTYFAPNTVNRSLSMDRWLEHLGTVFHLTEGAVEMML